jgi:hypothetical protein
MATRGSSKALSVEQEDFIATLYGGKRSASSGAADTDQGDVRTPSDLIECKVKGSYGKPTRAALVTTFEKIAEEAYTEGREPVLALRFYMPDSMLADSKGWVDLSVRRTADDAVNAEYAQRYQDLSR